MIFRNPAAKNLLFRRCITAQQLLNRLITDPDRVMPGIKTSAVPDKITDGTPVEKSAIQFRKRFPDRHQRIEGVDEDGIDVVRHSSDEEPFAALAFKIMTDPFVGKLAYIRVYSGTMNSGSYILNATKGPRDDYDSKAVKCQTV